MTSGKKYFRLLFIASLLAANQLCLAQISIKTNSDIRARGQFTTNASIINASTKANFEEAQVSLAGSDQQVSTVQPIKVNEIIVGEGGTKTLVGNWEVTGLLTLTDGILKVGNGAKLVYSGSERVEGNNTSFVDGILYRNSAGQLFFPIGANGTYAPAILEEAPGGEFGMRVVAPGTALILPPDVIGNFEDHYWEVSAAINSPVSLSLNGVRDFLGGGAPVVLETEAPGGTALSLSGSTGADFVTSIQNTTQTFFTIGKTAEFQLVIHDMITPFTVDNVNDKLSIENLELVTGNTVKLLDRWGLVIAEWVNYSNQTEYDFSKLSPGNYVCIVEYIYPGETRKVTAKGIVTILKSK